MKNLNLIGILLFINIPIACSQKENYPPITDFDESLYKLEKITDGIDIPWGLSFTGEDSFLVTDKKGILYHYSNGSKEIVEGVPDIVFTRQGGLLDVATDKDFDNNKIV